MHKYSQINNENKEGESWNLAQQHYAMPGLDLRTCPIPIGFDGIEGKVKALAKLQVVEVGLLLLEAVFADAAKSARCTAAELVSVPKFAFHGAPVEQPPLVCVAIVFMAHLRRIEETTTNWC